MTEHVHGTKSLKRSATSHCGHFSKVTRQKLQTKYPLTLPQPHCAWQPRNLKRTTLHRGWDLQKKQDSVSPISRECDMTSLGAGMRSQREVLEPKWPRMGWWGYEKPLASLGIMPGVELCRVLKLCSWLNLYLVSIACLTVGAYLTLTAKPHHKGTR